MTDDLPILYSFRRCPYAMRARMAITASGQQVQLRDILLRDKPDAMLQASPKGTVPVLVLPGGQVIDESLDVMQWALGRHDPDAWLVPLAADPGAEALIDECDGPFKHSLDRYKYPTRYEGVDAQEHRTRCLAFLRRLNSRLAGQAYLCGARLTVVDAAIIPFVRQCANTDRAWFDRQGLDHLRGWLDRFLQSELFLGIMRKGPIWHEGDQGPAFPDHGKTRDA